MVIKKKAPVKKKPKQPKTKRPPARKLGSKNVVSRARKKTDTKNKTTRSLRDRAQRGRPPVELSEEDTRKAILLARRGLTMIEIAEILSLSHVTLRYKLLANDDYMNSIKDAMQNYDKRIERALSERAFGYSHPEEKIFYDGKFGEVVRVQTIKHYPPDPTSMIFWLKNRQPDVWRDKRELEIPVPKGKRIVVTYEDGDDSQAGVAEDELGGEEG